MKQVQKHQFEHSKRPSRLAFKFCRFVQLVGIFFANNQLLHGFPSQLLGSNVTRLASKKWHRIAAFASYICILYLHPIFNICIPYLHPIFASYIAPNWSHLVTIFCCPELLKSSPLIAFLGRMVPYLRAGFWNCNPRRECVVPFPYHLETVLLHMENFIMANMESLTTGTTLS